MAKAKPSFPFDIDAFDLVNRAPSNPEAAAKALLLAAEYIGRGEQLPCSLADFLADAIQTAILTPERHDPVRADRGQALIVALHLKANNRRPSDVQDHEVYYFMKQWMEGLIDEKGNFSFKDAHKRVIGQTEAAKRAATKFDISSSTAKNIFNKWRKSGGRRFGPQEREVFTVAASNALRGTSRRKKGKTPRPEGTD